MRGRPIVLSKVGQAIGFALVAAAIIAAAVHVRSGVTTGRAASTIEADALAAELARCQAIGLQAETDRACLAAWAENRRRFFLSAPRNPEGAGPSVPQAQAR